MFPEAKEKVKDVASKGVDSAKETASKVADKGRGKSILTRLICKYCYWNWPCFVDVKESMKDTASEAKDYAKDTGSSLADKGRGKCKRINRFGKYLQNRLSESYFAF